MDESLFQFDRITVVDPLNATDPVENHVSIVNVKTITDKTLSLIVPKNYSVGFLKLWLCNEINKYSMTMCKIDDLNLVRMNEKLLDATLITELGDFPSVTLVQNYRTGYTGTKKPTVTIKKSITLDEIIEANKTLDVCYEDIEKKISDLKLANDEHTLGCMSLYVFDAICEFKRTQEKNMPMICTTEEVRRKLQEKHDMSRKLDYIKKKLKKSTEKRAKLLRKDDAKINFAGFKAGFLLKK